MPVSFPFLLCSFLLGVICTAEVARAVQQCRGGDCSVDDLRSVILQLQGEVKQSRAFSRDSNNCTSCFSGPCLNGGTCSPLPNFNYTCDCPANTTGANCETVLRCEENTCGPNAHCFVADHQINCVCNIGFSGADPYHEGCSLRTVESCFSGDPHYETFDHFRFDYQGSCSYVVSEPCNGSFPSFPYFSVRALNLFIVNTHVSVVKKAVLETYGTTIEVEIVRPSNELRLFVNGVVTTPPYYLGSPESWQIRVYPNSAHMLIETDYHVSVRIGTCGDLCVTVPKVDELIGSRTLCGLAGNIDDDCHDDMLMRDGTLLPAADCQQVSAEAERFGDSWIVPGQGPEENGDCMLGVVISNGTLPCDSQAVTDASRLCKPIDDAKNGDGVFGACKDMGADVIERYYTDCTFDLCQHGADKCTLLTQFVHACQMHLPGVCLDDWRTPVGCPLHCPFPGAQYSCCVSGCPPTCADYASASNCTRPCIEGCACSDGYVLQDGVCIEVGRCGCFDGSSLHDADSSWNTANCTVHNECHNGTISSSPMQCSPYAVCAVVDEQEQCRCLTGFAGDGLHCEDIDECATNTTCSQNVDQGSCNNTIGSYYCTCRPFYEGDQCQFYKPRRNCADLYVFHNDNVTGVKIIHPPFENAGRPAFSAVNVFCQMDIDGGGWTAVTGAEARANLSSGKTFKEYEYGFDDFNQDDFFIGLGFLNGETAQF